MNIYVWLLNMFHALIRFVVPCSVHHTDNTSPTLWIRMHHMTAVYITPHTLNNFNLHCFIISLFYFTLIFKSKILTKIIYIFNTMEYYGAKVKHWTCIVTLKLAGLLAETCWWTS